jgi:hypothetical protein
MKEIEIHAIRKVPEYSFVIISFSRYHSDAISLPVFDKSFETINYPDAITIFQTKMDNRYFKRKKFHQLARYQERHAINMNNL